MRFRYLGLHEAAITNLSWGPGMALYRSGQDAPAEVPDGATVQLQPGDEIELPAPLDPPHALLEPAQPPAPLEPAQPEPTPADPPSEEPAP